jgi:magnesium-transporting ATPase (P-type)
MEVLCLQVDVCCFDKTGTLTTDDMEFRGVVTLGSTVELETNPQKFPAHTLQALAACHALVLVDNKLVGDPLEKAALKGVDWTYTADQRAVPHRGNASPIQIIHRHQFSSHLKRMSVVVRVQDSSFVSQGCARDNSRTTSRSSPWIYRSLQIFHSARVSRISSSLQTTSRYGGWRGQKSRP